MINTIKRNKINNNITHKRPYRKENGISETSTTDTVFEIGSSAEKENVAEGKHKKWLFMNYIAADCNLKEFQKANIDNQELVGSDENTHIVAMIDVGPEAEPVSSNWSGCKTFYITQDNVSEKINSPVIEDRGDHVDMSNLDILKEFIINTMKKFPSDHVALILNDHGGGFTGALADETDGSFMSVSEIKQAISEAEKVTGKKIDILGFDACLMAETEVAYELKDTAAILLASEESEGGNGWTYSGMLNNNPAGRESINMLQKALKKKIDVSPEEFAKIVVKVNGEHNGEIPTFSATKLSQMDNLSHSVNEFAKAIIEASGNFDEKKEIKKAIKFSESYGEGTSPYGDLHDLHHLADMVGKKSSHTKVKETAEGLKKALNETIIANAANPSVYRNSKGLSIYAPTLIGSGLGYGYDRLSFAKDTQWDEAMMSLKYSSRVEEDNSFLLEEPAFWPDGSMR